MALAEWHQPDSEELTRTTRQVQVNRTNHRKTIGHCQKSGGAQKQKILGEIRQ
jgi:hypothetical protein